MRHRASFRLANGRIVLPRDIAQGDVVVRDGLIDTAAPERFDGETIDLDGDLLLPGLVELHTDNLERHLEPRPGTFVPVPLAIRAHDSELVAAGITTAFDALTLGGDERDDVRAFPLNRILVALRRESEGATLRCHHRLHLRCELSDETLPGRLDDLASPVRVAMVSLMDHTPGQGQYVNLDRFRRYYMKRYALDAEAVEALIVRRRAAHETRGEENRKAVIAFAKAADALLVTHDDSTVEDIAYAATIGARMAGFPTTALAAREAKKAGLHVLAGAPNMLRGTSLSGNVAAADLLRSGALDILSSDYYPASLLAALFKLSRDFANALPVAIAMATAIPAAVAGLSDRGTIQTGLRADLIRVRETGAGPHVVAVWRGGRRVL